MPNPNVGRLVVGKPVILNANLTTTEVEIISPISPIVRWNIKGRSFSEAGNEIRVGFNAGDTADFAGSPGDNGFITINDQRSWNEEDCEVHGFKFYARTSSGTASLEIELFPLATRQR